MQKLTTTQLFEKFAEHNEKYNVRSQFDDKNHLVGVIVFKSDNWPDKNFSLESRSYAFTSDNKFFIPGMGGNSIFARNLDGTDNIRLDWYLGQWRVDYCYIKED